MPWETDGRSWHIRSRRTRNGLPCKWSGQVLAEVVDRIEDSNLFAETDWNTRDLVKILPPNKSLGWFFHAQTGEEWLLRLKFRVPQSAFDKKQLEEDLWLKPVNQVPEIPLYGTQPRVRVDLVGPWQEVELRVFSYEEFNQPVFWDFIDRAVESFSSYTNALPSEKDEAKMPWKTDGEKWHRSKNGFCGNPPEPAWNISLLAKTIAVIRSAAPGAREVWTNKVTVPIYRSDFPDVLLGQLYTKNSEAFIIQLNLPKSNIPVYTSHVLGVETEVDESDPSCDVYYLRYVKESDFNPRILHMLITELLRRPLPKKD